MKKIYLALLAGLFTSQQIRAQLIPMVDPIKTPKYEFGSPLMDLTLNLGVGIEEQKVNGVWRNKTRMTGIQDAKGNQLKFGSEEWDTIGNAWVVETLINQELTYDGSGRVSTNHQVLIGATGKMVAKKSTYTYDGSGKYLPVTSLDTLFGSPTMMMGGVDSIVYNANGKIEQRVFARIYMGLYMIYARMKFTYDGSGQLSEMLSQDYKSSTSSWDNNERSTYTFTTAGKISVVKKEAFNDPNWEVDEIDSFFYDAGNKCIGTRTYISNGTIMEGDENQTYTYTGSDITEVVDKEWAAGAWVNVDKTAITYTGGVVSSALVYGWTGTAWSTEHYKRINFTGGSTGLSKLELSAIQLYPNPAKENISITGIHGGASATIIDMQGKEVGSTIQVQPGDVIAISHLNSGIYFIRILQDEQVLIKRFVKD